jgi:hypothetical protein
MKWVEVTQDQVSMVGFLPINEPQNYLTRYMVEGRQEVADDRRPLFVYLLLFFLGKVIQRLEIYIIWQRFQEYSFIDE